MTVALDPRISVSNGLRRQHVNVSVAERATGVAFFVRLRALDASGVYVLPATWTDNFVTLLPGERVQIQLEYEETMHVDLVTTRPFNEKK